MLGLELSEAYFAEYGKPMLEEQFPTILPLLCVGLFGPGSECFGYDDQLSRDHDFGPGFCILLPEESVVDRQSAFLLERAYAKLPREFRGFQREILSPVGGARKGVLRTAEVFESLVGSPDGVLNTQEWLTVTEQGLAEAVNGRLFFDNYGQVTEIRKRLEYYPEDVRLKRLAGNLLLAAQAGQYNYLRCLAHGEAAAAQLAVIAFVEHTMSAIFLLNREYQPYYKWRFRAFRKLRRLGTLADDLEGLLITGNDAALAERKTALVEKICGLLICALREEALSTSESPELETHAYLVNDRIKDAWLRNMHILAAV